MHTREHEEAGGREGRHPRTAGGWGGRCMSSTQRAPARASWPGGDNKHLRLQN